MQQHTAQCDCFVHQLLDITAIKLESVCTARAQKAEKAELWCMDVDSFILQRNVVP